MAEKKSKMTLELIDKVSSNLKKIDNNLYRSSRKWKKRAESMKKWGSALDSLGTKGLVGMTTLGTGMVYAAKQASNYNTEINKLATMSNLTTDQVGKLKESIAKTGKETGIAKLDMAELYRQLGQAGVEVENLDKIASSSVHIGRILGDTDYAKVGGELVNTLNAVGVAYKDTSKFLDKATVSTNISNQTLADNFQALQKSGAIFKSAVPDANKYQAILASLAQKGLKGTEAGTMLNATISKVMDTSGKSAKAIQGLGISLKDSKNNAKDFYQIVEEIANSKAYKKMSENEKLNFSKDIAGVEHSSKFKGLLDSAEEGKLSKNKKEIEKSSNAFEKFAKTVDPIIKIFDRFKASALNIILDIGESLANNPEVIKTLEGWANSFEKLAEKVKKFAESKEGKEIMAGIVKELPKLIVAFAGMKVVGKGAVTLGKLYEAISKFKKLKGDELYKTLKDLKKIEKTLGEGGSWKDLTRQQQKSYRKGQKWARRGKLGQELPELGEEIVKKSKVKSLLSKMKNLGILARKNFIKGFSKFNPAKLFGKITKGGFSKVLKVGGWAEGFRLGWKATKKATDKATDIMMKEGGKKVTETHFKNTSFSAPLISAEASRAQGWDFGLKDGIRDLGKWLDKTIPDDLFIFHIGEKMQKGLHVEEIKAKLSEMKEGFSTWLTQDLPESPIFHLDEKINGVMSNAKEYVSDKWGSIRNTLSQTVNGKIDMLRSTFETGYTSVSRKWGILKSKLKQTLKGKVTMLANGFFAMCKTIGEKWDALKRKLSNGIHGAINIVRNFTGGESDIDGSHATGLSRVPRDNYLANLHKDEMVLTKRQADKLRYGKINNNNKSIVNNININASMSNDLDVENVAKQIARHLEFA